MAAGSDSDNGRVPPSLRTGVAANYSSIADETNVWDDGPLLPPANQSDDGTTVDVARVPSVLRPGASHKEPEAMEDSHTGDQITRIPTVLRPAGGAARAETNPFKRKPIAAPSSVPGGPPDYNNGQATAPIELSTPAPPAIRTMPSLSQLSVDEASKNPWQPALDEKKDSLAPPPPAIHGGLEQDSAQDIWDFGQPSQRASPGLASNSPALVSLPSEGDLAAWDEEGSKKLPMPAVPAKQFASPDDDVFEDSHAWDDLGNLNKGKAPMKPVLAPPLANAGSSGLVDDWNLVDIEGHPGPPSRQSTWENFADAPEGPSASPKQPAQPKEQQEVPPPPPPRPVSKSETYQIKNINWYDATAPKNPRTSPILVQNANGPCPLVALVNALTLTTPATAANTALVETLRSREQVSLGLLLDAVFDELIRRNDPSVPLPDVTELYDFLKGLHTGMNVNPRYIPTPDLITSFKRTSLTHIHPTERGDLIPGTFEVTKEMSLYSTFSIPLYHGWLPAKDEPAYESFARQAVSYEDAQNLLFREEELEERLSSNSHRGLSEEEQQVYQDILTIKSFLSISATQLTPWGLEVVTKAMEPGSVSILFRNDHFSTLYRHPQTLQLLGLVTDAGYAGHEEVVWESLVDVNGERAEFFSGDFRLVGGAGHGQLGVGSSQGGSGGVGEWPPSPSGTESGPVSTNGWAPGPVRRSHGEANQEDDLDNGPLSPSTEQEDRDLALALQLQEEEDERHRAEQDRRNRESRLSEQFIEQQARTQPPSSMGRGGARGGASLGSRGSSRGSTASTTPARSSVSIPVTSSPPVSRGRTGIRGGATPARGAAVPPRAGRGGGVQNVRSLLPPRSQAVTRPADDGLEDAPPSYEQAARQNPYVPPEGHPSHPTSSPDRQASEAGQRRQTPPPSINTAPTGRRTAGIPTYPGANTPGRMRQGIPPAAVTSTAGSGRDRDCVVM